MEVSAYIRISTVDVHSIRGINIAGSPKLTLIIPRGVDDVAVLGNTEGSDFISGVDLVQVELNWRESAIFEALADQVIHTDE